MLPGNTVVCETGAQPVVTYGNDAYTTSLLHFKEPVGWDLAATGIADDGAAAGTVSWQAAGNVKIQGGPSHPSWFHRSCMIDNRSGSGSSYLALQGSGAPQAKVWSAGDFTVDFWVYPLTANQGCPVAKTTTATNFAPYLFLQTNTGRWQFYSSSNNSSWDIANAVDIGACTANQWHHLAVQRKVNTWTAYLDGAQTATWTSSATPWRDDNANLLIGIQNSAVNLWTGMVDEFRFSQIARYSGAFAPPREPYYGALNGGNDEATTTLLHFDGANSGTVFTNDGRGGLTPSFGGANAITATGNFKFGTACLDPTANNGRIAVSNCSDFDFYVQNFTIDFWYYRYTAYQQQLVGKHQLGTVFSPFMLMDVNGTLNLYMSGTGSSWDLVNGLNCGTIPSNVWTHIALVVRNQTAYVYINGVQQNSAALSGQLWINADYLTIGATADNAGSVTPGLFDEFRVSDVARWSANFTPPSAPYGPNPGAGPLAWPAEYFGTPIDTQVVYHNHFDGANGSTTIPADSSWRNHPTYTGASGLALNTGAFKFGTSSVYTDGAAGYFYLDGSSDFSFGTGDFTIEMWFRCQVLPSSSGHSCLYDGRGPSQSNMCPILFLDGSPTTLRFCTPTGNITPAVGTPIVAGTWYHAAWSRRSGVTYCFLNGVLEAGPYTDSNNYGIWPQNRPILGTDGNAATWFYNGFIDELRISKGIGRWIANFTPPTAKYPGCLHTVFSAAGSSNYNVPADWNPIGNVAISYGAGGGGQPGTSGSGPGDGGGGGGCSYSFDLPLLPGISVPTAVGAAGVGGSGNTGGDTSFGALGGNSVTTSNQVYARAGVGGASGSQGGATSSPAVGQHLYAGGAGGIRAGGGGAGGGGGAAGVFGNGANGGNGSSAGYGGGGGGGANGGGAGNAGTASGYPGGSGGGTGSAGAGWGGGGGGGTNAAGGAGLGGGGGGGGGGGSGAGAGNGGVGSNDNQSGGGGGGGGGSPSTVGAGLGGNAPNYGGGGGGGGTSPSSLPPGGNAGGGAIQVSYIGANS